MLATSLRGLRVLDASRVLAGPYAGQVLADLGAEVIKVEQPGAGDETRQWGPPFVGDLSAYYLSCNRGKRGLTLDLKQPEGAALFRRLAAKSDVVLENFRPDSARTLGLTAADLHQVNPRLVVCSISGYGRDGSWADKPGYDFVVQGLSGMMAMTGPVEGPPHKVGVAIADIATGLYAAVAVLAALNGRRETGQGYAIELALIDCAVATMANVAQAFVSSGKVPERQGNAHLQIVPYQQFATKDGFLILAVGNDGQWRKFCAVAARPELATDVRFATNAERVRNRLALVPLVAEVMTTRGTAEWQAALDAQGVPAGPIWDFAQLFASDLARERGLRMTARRADGTPVDLLRSPLTRTVRPDAAPPGLGEHSEAVLRDVLGLGGDEVAALRRGGII